MRDLRKEAKAFVDAHKAVKKRLEAVFQIEEEIRSIGAAVEVGTHGISQSSLDDALKRNDTDFWDAFLTMLATSERSLPGPRDATRVSDADLWNCFMRRIPDSEHLFPDDDDEYVFDTSLWSFLKHRREYPVFSLESIIEVFSEAYARRRSMFIGLFRSLSWDHAVNTPKAFRGHVVIHDAVTVWSHGRMRGHSGLNALARHLVDDLYLAFRILDGKPVADRERALSEVLHEAIRDGARTNTMRHRNLFKFKWFRNGNLRIGLLQADLVKDMNALMKKLPWSIVQESSGPSRAATAQRVLEIP